MMWLKSCVYDRLMWWKRTEVWIQTLDLNTAFVTMVWSSPEFFLICNWTWDSRQTTALPLAFGWWKKGPWNGSKSQWPSCLSWRILRQSVSWGQKIVSFCLCRLSWVNLGAGSLLNLSKKKLGYDHFADFEFVILHWDVFTIDFFQRIFFCIYMFIHIAQLRSPC